MFIRDLQPKTAAEIQAAQVQATEVLRAHAELSARRTGRQPSELGTGAAARQPAFRR